MQEKPYRILNIQKWSEDVEVWYIHIRNTARDVCNCWILDDPISFWILAIPLPELRENTLHIHTPLSGHEGKSPSNPS